MKASTIAQRDQLLAALNQRGIASTTELAAAIRVPFGRYGEVWRNLQALYKRGLIGKEKFDGMTAVVWTAQPAPLSADPGDST